MLESQSLTFLEGAKAGKNAKKTLSGAGSQAFLEGARAGKCFFIKRLLGAGPFFEGSRSREPVKKGPDIQH